MCVLAYLLVSYINIYIYIYILSIMIPNIIKQDYDRKITLLNGITNDTEYQHSINLYFAVLLLNRFC